MLRAGGFRFRFGELNCVGSSMVGWAESRGFNIRGRGEWRGRLREVM